MKESGAAFRQAWRLLGVKLSPPKDVGRPTDDRELGWEDLIKKPSE